MKDTFYSNEKDVSAVIFCEPADPVSNRLALKYTYVDNTPRGLETFLGFARKFPTAKYINFYSRKTRAYLGRRVLSE